MEEYKRILSACFAENKDAVFERVEVYGNFPPNLCKFIGAVMADDGKFNRAKCVGGILAQDGSIWQVSAFGRFIYRIVFSGIKTQLSAEFLKQPYFSGY